MFDIEVFLKASIEKIGSIQEIEIVYEQYDDYRVRLMMTAFNGKHPAKFNDYNCEPVMEFRFGEGTTDKKYLESKIIANNLRSYIKKNFPHIKVYRATKCTFAWFGE